MKSIYLNIAKKTLSFVTSLIMILSLVFAVQLDFSMVFADTSIGQNVRIELDTIDFSQPMTIAPELINGLSFSDSIDAVDNGKTVIALGAPSVGGNTFKYLISADGNEVPTPVVNSDASGWMAVANGDNITVDDGKHIGVAEVDNAGKVVRFSDAVAVVVNETADLSNLTLSNGTLSPAFNTNTYSYSSSVANSVDKIRLTPNAVDSSATIKVNGIVVASGAASGDIPLNLGDNTISVEVTSNTGELVQNYNVVVTREARIPYLSSLRINGIFGGGLTPKFSQEIFNYTSNVSTRTSINIVITADNPADTSLRVEKISLITGEVILSVPLTSGVTSVAIPMDIGDNMLRVVIKNNGDSGSSEYIIIANRTS